MADRTETSDCRTTPLKIEYLKINAAKTTAVCVWTEQGVSSPESRS